MAIQTLSVLLDAAQARIDDQASYKGAMPPRDAFSVLQQAPGARLVDVRTRAELDWVGRIPGAVEIEIKYYPEMKLNPNFLTELKRQVDPESLVLFICRSGQRSAAAAEMSARIGYNDCYNVLEGFEGDRDANNQRGYRNGWKLAGLPWEQS